MKARRFPIVDRSRGHPATPSSLVDFGLGQGEEWDASAILDSPTWSLFCFHVKLGEAVFVETPEQVDLLGGPFLYGEQYEHAHHVLKVPLADLPELTRDRVVRDERLTWVHSVGRCGSTLLSKAMATCPGVWSVSEPDVLLDVQELKTSGKLPEEEFLDVLSATVALVCKDAPARPDLQMVIKPRSQVSELMPQLQEVFPRCRQLFMTRDPMTWIKSVFSAYMRDYDPKDVGGRRGFEDTTALWLPLLKEEGDPVQPMSYPKLWALNLIAGEQKWAQMGKLARPEFKLSYEKIKQSPEAELRELFNNLGFPFDEKKLQETVARDSQEGTHFAQDAQGRDSYEMRPEDQDEARAVFEKFDLL